MSEQNGRISVAENGTVSQLKYDGKLTNGNVVSEDSGIGSRRSSDDYIKNGLDLDSQVKKASTSGKESIAPAVRKFVKLRHVGQERPVCSDTLHTKCIEVSYFLHLSFRYILALFALNSQNKKQQKHVTMSYTWFGDFCSYIFSEAPL
ncbi:hypothetical protein DPMN_016054 [Dreissena polymorpha]|uniref:Uncharacterized protein n=1 Tax=Dreissena polymorpha TaxID=45954 RepID=A0A9D4S477_DREPO|nr:hypothetical protein DPMN_016054 [Dreissena polymorpha]